MAVEVFITVTDVQNQEEEDVIVDEIEDGEVVESTVSEPAVYYDSSKSFFDSISCEANKSSTDRYHTTGKLDRRKNGLIKKVDKMLQLDKHLQ